MTPDSQPLLSNSEPEGPPEPIFVDLNDGYGPPAGRRFVVALVVIVGLVWSATLILWAL